MLKKLLKKLIIKKKKINSDDIAKASAFISAHMHEAERRYSEAEQKIASSMAALDRMAR